MDVLLMALAGIGVMMMIIGRHIMIRDTGGDLPLVWIVVLRIVPFSELIYMVRHYAQAKTGGIVSIIGMWLLVPFLGNSIWEQQMAAKATISRFEQQLEDKLSAADESEISAEMLAELPAEARAQYSRDRVSQLTAKSLKVAQVQERLQQWFAQLQKTRASLSNDPAEVNRFNAEAAAYASFNAVAKEESAELQALQANPAAKR